MSPGQTAVSLASSYLESNNNPTKATLPRLPKGLVCPLCLLPASPYKKKKGKKESRSQLPNFYPSGLEAMRKLSQGILRNQKACNGEIST